MNPTSSPAVVNLSERRAAKRDRVVFADLADTLAAAVVTDRGLTAIQPSSAISKFVRWYTDAANELLVAVVAPTEPPTRVEEVLAFALAWRQNRDLLLVLSPEQCKQVIPRGGWAGTPVRVWEYDDTLVPRWVPDPSRAEVLAAVLDGQHVEPRDGDRLSHELGQDWLTLLLRRPEMADPTRDDQRTGPGDVAPGLHVGGGTRPAQTRRSVSHLEQLAPQLIGELERITLPFSDHAPCDAELRIAQTQLDDWLERLSNGIQAELFALQMAAQQRLLDIADLAAASARCRATNAGQDLRPQPVPRSRYAGSGAERPELREHLNRTGAIPEEQRLHPSARRNQVADL
jgi:hypothetical protein